MKKLFICLVAVLFSACQPLPARFTQVDAKDGSLPASPAAPPVTGEARVERIGLRDSHAPTPRDLPRSAFAMSTFGEIDLRGWTRSVGSLDQTVAARFEAAAFKIVSTTKDSLKLDLVMKREWQGEPASVVLTPGNTSGLFAGVLPLLKLNIEVRCVPQGPEGPCDPTRQATILIWTQGQNASAGGRSAFLYQSADVTGRLSGNITPNFDSEVSGNLTVVTQLPAETQNHIDLSLKLKNKYGSLVFTVPAGQDQWRLDSDQSNNVYRRRFDVSPGDGKIRLPLDPTSLNLPLVERTLGFLQAGKGNLEISIQR